MESNGHFLILYLYYYARQTQHQRLNVLENFVSVCACTFEYMVIEREGVFVCVHVILRVYVSVCECE